MPKRRGKKDTRLRGRRVVQGVGVRVVVSLRLPRDLIERIEEARNQLEAHRVSDMTRTAAIELILERGLETMGLRPERTREPDAGGQGGGWRGELQRSTHAPPTPAGTAPELSGDFVAPPPKIRD